MAMKLELLESELTSVEESHASKATIVQFLRKVRTCGIRRSTLVLKWGTILLRKQASSLGDELFDIQEQVAIAALDCGAIPIAVQLCESIDEIFPRSHRVRRLAAMIFEAQGEFTKALDIYKQMIAVEKRPLPEPTGEEDDVPIDPVEWELGTEAMAKVPDAHVMRRMVAVHEAMGNSEEAIRQLNMHVQFYATDVEAWAKLADLYKDKGDFKNAAFCYEELILLEPASPSYPRLLGETLCCSGKQKDILMARKYFASAVELCGEKEDNPFLQRCLWDLLWVVKHLGLDDRVNEQLWKKGKSKLLKAYKKDGKLYSVAVAALMGEALELKQVEEEEENVVEEKEEEGDGGGLVADVDDVD